MKVGWGGRIRTYDTRYQKPMPYHLATPQSDWMLQFSEQVSCNQACSCPDDPQNSANLPNAAADHGEMPPAGVSAGDNLVGFVQYPAC